MPVSPKGDSYKTENRAFSVEEMLRLAGRRDDRVRELKSPRITQQNGCRIFMP
jgi:hypothetical protein